MAAKEKKDTSQLGKTLLKVAIGLVLLSWGVRSIWLWRFDVLVLVRGAIGIFAAIIGIVFLAMAKE